MWWACQDLNQRPHPERKIARVPTGSAAPRAELGRADPILIPRGGPPAMGVLSAKRREPMCGTPFLQVTPDRCGRSYQGESRVLDSPEGVCAGQAGFEYPATSVPFSKCSPGVQLSALFLWFAMMDRFVI